MQHALYHHIRRFIDLDEAQYAAIYPYFDGLQLEKKEVLIHAGDKCRELFFVAKGCLHAYFIDDHGLEKTVQFAIEDWWLTDFLAFHHQKPSSFYIQAVEPTQVMCITHERREQLFTDYPLMERYFRQVYEIGFGAAMTRVKMIYQYSKEEIFYRFREEYPDFVNRVPQYMVATFLGLTAEYLSKLRSKKLS